jgi:hypothetical protein
MTEYTDSPEAIAAWQEQVARTGLWISRLHHQPTHDFEFVSPDATPTARDDASVADIEPDDWDRYSSKSVPPRMMLRYGNGQPDLPIEEYQGGSRRQHRSPTQARPMPTLNTHPQPEEIQIRPSRSNSSGNPTPVSARPPRSRTSSYAAGSIQPTPLTGPNVPPYPQQIAVWKSDGQRVSPQASSSHGHGDYGAPPIAHSATHPPTHHPNIEPRHSISTAPLPVPYRGTAGPSQPQQLSYTQSNPAHPAVHPSHVSSRHSIQPHHPASPLSASTHTNVGRTRHESLVHDYAPAAPTAGTHASSSRRGPPKVYSSRAQSRAGSQPPSVVYAARAGNAAIDERFDPPSMTSRIPPDDPRYASVRSGGRGSTHGHGRSRLGHDSGYGPGHEDEERDRERERERGRGRTARHEEHEHHARDHSVGSAVLIDAPSARSRTLSPSRGGHDRNRERSRGRGHQHQHDHEHNHERSHRHGHDRERTGGSPERSSTRDYRRERSVPRTVSSGSTYYVLPNKGQKVHVLVCCFALAMPYRSCP